MFLRNIFVKEREEVLIRTEKERKQILRKNSFKTKMRDKKACIITKITNWIESICSVIHNIKTCGVRMARTKAMKETRSFLTHGTGDGTNLREQVHVWTQDNGRAGCSVSSRRVCSLIVGINTMT